MSSVIKCENLILVGSIINLIYNNLLLVKVFLQNCIAGNSLFLNKYVLLLNLFLLKCNACIFTIKIRFHSVLNALWGLTIWP